MNNLKFHKGIGIIKIQTIKLALIGALIGIAFESVWAGCNLPNGLGNVDIALKSIEFADDNIVYSDGGNPYANTDWETNKKQPVSYKSGERLKVKATWTLSRSGLSVSNWRVRGTGPDNIKIGHTGTGKSVTVSGTVLTMAFSYDDQNASFAAGTVKYYPHFKISWEFSFDSGTTWESCSTGENDNLMYITKGEPAATLYHTPLHIGCSNANGMTEDSSIVAAIWGEFINRDVKKVNPTTGLQAGAGMKYYDPPNTAPSSLELLLSSGNGRCVAWANFMHCMLSIHHIDSEVETILPKPMTGYTGNGILVKERLWVDRYTVPGIGNPADAQGNDTPPSYFDCHVVVVYNNEIYDPSYGGNNGISSDLLDWQRKSLDAVGYKSVASGYKYYIQCLSNDVGSSVEFE